MPECVCGFNPPSEPNPDCERCQLVSQVEALTAAIREHRDQRGDNRCWLDDVKLYAAIGDGSDPYDVDFSLPPKADFLESCRRFWEMRQKGGFEGEAQLPGCMTIAQLTERIAALTADLAKARADWDNLNRYADAATAAIALASDLTDRLEEASLPAELEELRHTTHYACRDVTHWSDEKYGPLATDELRAGLALAEAKVASLTAENAALRAERDRVKGQRDRATWNWLSVESQGSGVGIEEIARRTAMHEVEPATAARVGAAVFGGEGEHAND